MTEESFEKVLDKIKKLLAVAQHEATDVNEAASMAAMAQKLMSKHQIDEAMLKVDAADDDEDEAVEDHGVFDQGKRNTTWRTSLAGTIARANGCKVYTRTSATAANNGICIVGKRSNMIASLTIFYYCKAEITHLTKKHGYGLGKVWCNNFRLGCVSAIGDSIKLEQQSLEKEMYAEHSNDSSALVVLDNALALVKNESKSVQRWMNEHMNMGRSQASAFTSNAAAFRSGINAGQTIYNGRHSKLEG